MKKAWQKVKQETARAVDNAVTAVEDGTLAKEAERIGQQIGKTAEKAGQQVSDVVEKAADQSKEAIIRAQTADQRAEANQRENRCATKVATFKATLPATFPQTKDDKADAATLDLLIKVINELAEKIRSRDQAEHSDFAYKSEITDNPKQDCKIWLAAQSIHEDSLDLLCSEIKTRLNKIQSAAATELKPLILSDAAKAIFGGAKPTTTTAKSFDEAALAAAFSETLGTKAKHEDGFEHVDSDLESVGSAPKRKLSQG